jgi:protein TonB
MGYQALLFCPDEKTARTVTQVLSELEFNVESCIEPFAAVKKLMGQHFDAVVVDCDNEQNATLLFKSARNSTSNQASLAVAVVEGQAGVAKAFRIGANLVLTKPINIEQAKGTLRVARGLLRKSDPAKPAATAPPVPPAAPVAAKPVPSVKPAVPATLTAASTLRQAAPPIAKPAPTPAWPAPPAVAAASSTPAAHEQVLPEINVKDSVVAPAPVAPAVSPAPAEVKTSFNAGLPASHGGGAASAPAPAREIPAAPAMEPSPKSTATDAGALFATKEAPPNASLSYSGSAPSFSFGGANAPAESSGRSKKIFLGVAAVAIATVALYVGWTKFQGHSSQPEATPTTSTAAPAATAAASPIAKPSAQPAAPTTSASQPISQPAVAPARSQPADEVESAPDAAGASTSTSTKGSTTSTPSANKTASEPKTEDAPLIVKGGKAPAVHAAPAAADTPAPSMIGIAATGTSAPPPDLGNSEAIAPRPLLQTLNISQGVSRGLLIKKVQPIYPKNALFMQVEGSVELMATISKSGDITHVKVLSGDSQLTKAATDAVKQWKYKPYLLNGEPVEIQTQVTINFKLPR